MIWNILIEFKNYITNKMNLIGELTPEKEMEKFNSNNWINSVWKTKDCRRCHLDVVDVRDTKKLWMMHFCIFPNLDNDSPVFGFDVVAGEKKCTGVFHDFSNVTKEDHEMTKWFINHMKDFKPTKERNLPEWARNIFSDGMVAASNVQDEEELNKIIELSKINLNYYLDNVEKYTKINNNKYLIKEGQNYYCENQKKNPHTPRVMKSLGLNEDDVDQFCNHLLFPEINID